MRKAMTDIWIEIEKLKIKMDGKDKEIERLEDEVRELKGEIDSCGYLYGPAVDIITTGSMTISYPYMRKAKIPTSKVVEKILAHLNLDIEQVPAKPESIQLKKIIDKKDNRRR